jgi:hypothetical protein
LTKATPGALYPIGDLFIALSVLGWEAGMTTRRSKAKIPRPRSGHGSADRFREGIDEAVAKFGKRVAPLLSAKIGQGEANISPAVEELLRDVTNLLGFDMNAHREATDHFLGVRPDLAIDVESAGIGVVELKAPGMGVPGAARWGKARDRVQWEKLQALPNVLYTDGTHWAKYTFGQRQGEVATLIVV